MSVEMDKDKLNAILSMCAKNEILAIERAKEIETLTKNLADAQGDNAQEAMENKQLAEQVETLKAEIERMKAARIEIPPPPEGFEAVLHLPQMSSQCSQADFELTSQGWKKPSFGISSAQIIARKKEMMK